MCGMKQGRLNVAADPLMTLTYVGSKGWTRDRRQQMSPSLFSCQNGQDNRKYGRLANIPMLGAFICPRSKRYDSFSR